MHRIYQKFAAKINESVTLDKASSHHLINVLRLQQGEKFILFNGEGGEYQAEIISVQKSQVQAQLKEFNDINRESPLFIHLAQSIARGEKMDFIIQKAVELGVQKITPLFTEFCNVKLEPDRMEKKIKHWQQIIISAAEQSGRAQIPQLMPAQQFSNWLPHCQEQLKIILHPHINKINQPLSESSKSICLVVGSEGGFSELEIQQAIQYGFQAMQLGPRILRTETAGFVAITLMQCQLGDFR